MASTLSPRGGGGDGGGGGDATSSASSNLSSYLSDRAPGLVFSGWYADRVWVESVGAFRDRVRADPEETEAGRILRGVARRARKEEKAGLFACVESKCVCGGGSLKFGAHVNFFSRDLAHVWLLVFFH